MTSSASLYQTHPQQLRVATLNLWGLFCDWPQRLTWLASRWEAEVAADVLLCQEVCVGEGFDQAEETAAALGFAHHATALASEHEDYQEGVAILSRYPLERIIAQPLPASVPARAALSADLILGGSTLRVATTHAVYAPEPVRRAQLEALVRMLARGPAVVGADLNTTPSELAGEAVNLCGLDDVFADSDLLSWPNDAETLRSAWRARLGREPVFGLEKRRLDYLLTRDLRVLTRGSSLLGDISSGFVSDHAALWVDVAVRS